VNRPPSRAIQAAWLLAFVCAAGALQALQPLPFDLDTSYHFAVARLIHDYGILQAFPWTTFSWLADHYADKELLFHLLLVPFVSLPIGLAANVVGTVLGAGVLFLLYRILVAEGVPRAGFWTLAALASSGTFAMRLALVRPHLLGVPLALAITWAAARRRWIVLALAALLYPLSYVGWPTAIVLAVLVELARWISAGRADWRAPAVVVAGTGIAVLLHPNFPNNVSYFWIEVVEGLVKTGWNKAGGIHIGDENQPFTIGGVRRQLVIPIALTLAGAFGAWRHRRADAVPLAFALGAIAFLGLTLRTQRFVEYLAPFAAASAALGLRGVRDAVLGPAIFAIAAVHAAVFSLKASVLRLPTRVDAVNPEVTSALQHLIPPGDQVFTCGWEETGELMLALRGRRFMVALDPVLFRHQDPERYAEWYSITRQPPDRPAPIVRDLFGARYVVCSTAPEFRTFLETLSRDPEARLVFQTPYVVALAIAPGARTAPPADRAR
jgi:hypothetical protein